MATFGEANQAKLSLKMTLSNYAWYNNIIVAPDGDDWCIVVGVAIMNPTIRKVVPIVHNFVTVKVDVETKKKK